jgi:hypothetical protein
VSDVDPKSMTNTSFVSPLTWSGMQPVSNVSNVISSWTKTALASSEMGRPTANEIMLGEKSVTTTKKI